LPTVSTKAFAGSTTTWSPPGSGSVGKSSVRSVRMWKRAGPQMISTSCSEERSSSVREPDGSWPGHVEHEARGQDHGPLALDLGDERHAQADLHVGGAQLDLAAGGVDLHAREGLDGRTGRRDPGRGLQLAEQLLARG
jgi:hypothetical protein